MKTMPSGHPSDEELLDLTEGQLNPVYAARLHKHIETCPACQARQTQQARIARQVSDTLAQVAGAVPFSSGPSWAAVAARLRSARRTAYLGQTLRLAASAAAVVVFALGLLSLRAFLQPQPVVEPLATPARTVEKPSLVPTATIPPTSTPAPKAAGRITVLLAGVDRRPGEKGAGLTDSMLLLSLDRARNAGLMLSIPRDLWVEIPGHGPGRINTAYALGEESQTGGAALLKQTVGDALGVRVDHVVRLEFNAVVAFIDAVGGVEIEVPGAIDDPLFPDSAYGYDPLFIPAGQQHMDGALALKYMRTRHGSSDFERAARQQQVLVAIRGKLARLDTWPELVKRAPELIAQVQNAIVTDLGVPGMIELAQQGRDLPDGALRTAVLDGRYVVDYVTPEGAQVLLPLKDQVSRLVNDIFETGLVPATPEVEMARVSVLNGTLQAGLAGQTAALLREKGFNVAQVGNASHFGYERTTIVDHTGRPATVKALAELLKLEAGSLVYQPDPVAPAEVEVILGDDLALP
ncbi:MAG: LCP family protein [Thermoflexales bacterium]|nr:LCP family protein [Thermoflexales bacterium]